jgi:NAD(P)-dependent dehydrogenase (short-subunit alcohol dehydrogenase family)
MTSSTKPVALMTGAASGIGAAIARRLAADRFAVVLDSRSSAEAGRAMAAAMTNAIYIQTDLADEAARVQLIDQPAAQWGRLDLIVNNAGVSRVIPHGDLAAATPEIWQELHEVNVIAPWHLITLAVPQLRRSVPRPAS